MRVSFLAASVAICSVLAPVVSAQTPACKATIKVAASGAVTIFENGKQIPDRDLRVPYGCPAPGFVLTFAPQAGEQLFLASFRRGSDQSKSFTPCDRDQYDLSPGNDTCVISDVTNKIPTCTVNSGACFKYTAVGLGGNVDPKVIVNTGTLTKPSKKHRP